MTDPRYPQSPFGQNNNQNPYEPAQYPVQGNSNKKRIVAGGPVASSRRLARMKRAQLRRNILIAISVILGLLMALIATDTLKLGTGPQPSLQSESSISADPALPVEVAGIEATNIRTPTTDDPLRVYIGGDSLAGSYGFNLATQLGKTGLIEPVYDSRPSSGLTNPDFFDWEKHSREVLSTYDPEVLFLSLGTNDASIVSTDRRNYEEQYGKLVENIIDIVETNERTLYFVLAPAMRDSKLNSNLQKLNQVIKSTAEKNQAYVIDMGQILSPDNKFVSTLRLSGSNKTIRTADGVHITGTGGKAVSNQIYAALLNAFRIQPDPLAKAITPIKAKGWGSTIRRNTTTSSTRPSVKTQSTSSTSTTTSTPPDTSTVENTTPESTEAPQEDSEI